MKNHAQTNPNAQAKALFRSLVLAVISAHSFCISALGQKLDEF